MDEARRFRRPPRAVGRGGGAERRGRHALKRWRARGSSASRSVMPRRSCWAAVGRRRRRAVGAAAARWSARVVTHSASTSALLSLGIAVVLPQFRGTLGYGRAFGDCCSGAPASTTSKIAPRSQGQALARSSTRSTRRAAVFGGSHGGFRRGLVGSPRHRDLFRAAVLGVNPVVDLPAMVGTTDIPEWRAAEDSAGRAALAPRRRRP